MIVHGGCRLCLAGCVQRGAVIHQSGPCGQRTATHVHVSTPATTTTGRPPEFHAWSFTQQREQVSYGENQPACLASVKSYRQPHSIKTNKSAHDRKSRNVRNHSNSSNNNNKTMHGSVDPHRNGIAKTSSCFTAMYI